MKMDLFQLAALLIAVSSAVNGIILDEENQESRTYSSNYDPEEEHDGKEAEYGPSLVKDEKGIIHHQVDGFARTTPLNYGSTKSEPSVYPYIGMIEDPAEHGIDSESLAVDNGFGFPDLAQSGLAFDAGLAKNYQLERDAELSKKGLALQAEIASFANEGFAYYPTMELVEEEEIVRGLDKVPGYGPHQLDEENPAAAEEKAEENSEQGFPHNPRKIKEPVKEVAIDKTLDYVLENGVQRPSKKGSNNFPFEVTAAEESVMEKEKAAFSKALKAEELAELGLLYYPLLAFKNIPFELREAELKREIFEKIGDPFPAPPKFVVTSHSYQNQVPNYLYSDAIPKPEGFAYGGPTKAEFLNEYDTRYI